LLLAFSGAQWDAPSRTLSFDPRADGRFLFTAGDAWGRADIDGDDLTLHIDGGTLDLDRLMLRGREASAAVHLTSGACHTARAATADHSHQETP
jgi:hypothetical protein